MTRSFDVELISVNVGLPAVLGKWRGKEIVSGIRKRAVVGTQWLWLGSEGLEGDGQADTRLHKGKRIHGGPLKAVYAYPYDHYPRWAELLDQELVPGDFGENLTVQGLTEERVFPGDRWAWGQAILEVTSPRRPCYKLDMLRGEGTAKRMQATGWCGWYFRIVKPGLVPVDTQNLLTIPSHSQLSPSIAQLFVEKIRKDPEVPDV